MRPSDFDSDSDEDEEVVRAKRLGRNIGPVMDTFADHSLQITSYRSSVHKMIIPADKIIEEPTSSSEFNTTKSP